ncbi:sensor histidine kinase [Idiomarina xiamenensis]|uniref:histidine kinase n=1 Tax=Idiomarina xiamenensis 10-D-4 TaxID=740709 RepID=K2K190_9GAMM|nr:ATP-binding protein [Idiomarina xiamenensis]EKE80507.1 histidine kinase [Idiomarina xiamenensis 10-D-4]
MSSQPITEAFCPKRLQRSFDVLPHAVVLLDSDGVIRYQNTAASQLFETQLRGQLWREVVSRLFAPKADDGHELSLFNGRRVRVDISSLAPDPGQLIVLTDLTETRALQARIGQLQRLSSLGRTVAALAHQIRTPLSAAMLYAHNLNSSLLDESQRLNFSDKLVNRLQSIEHQVNDMLLFAKSGEQQVVEKIELVDLLTHVQGQLEAVEKRYQTQISWPSNVPAASLTGNLTALSGALQNLLVNALQAAPVNAAQVAVRLRFSEQQLQLEVEDNGCGIDSAQQQRIFTPFYTDKAHGTGLGLAVVQAVIKAHQGQISVTSQVGQGSCFSVILPAQHCVSDSLAEVMHHYG